MIHYHAWLSQDPATQQIQQQRNEAQAAQFYIALRPIGVAVEALSSLVTAGVGTLGSLSQRQSDLGEVSAQKTAPREAEAQHCDVVVLDEVRPPSLAPAIASGEISQHGKRSAA